MTIYLSNKKYYKKEDSFSKKMNYTNAIFGASNQDLIEIMNNPYISKNYIIWYVIQTEEKAE